MDLRTQIHGLLLEELESFQAQSGATTGTDDDTPLFGEGSTLDSIGLVMVLTGFEGRINDSMGTDIVLASEKAMSMSRSPFRSIKSLVEYACELVQVVGQ